MGRLPRLVDGAGARTADLLSVVPETVAVLVEAGPAGRGGGRHRPAGAAPASSSRPGARPRPSCATGWCWAAPATRRVRSATSPPPGGRSRRSTLRGSSARSCSRKGRPCVASAGATTRRLCWNGPRRCSTALGADPARDRARDELARARPRPRSTDRPTAAERRVAALVSTGLTNKEVAAQLFTSVATVEAHLTRLYSKVGVRSRTQLARRVAEGLLDVEP